MTISKGNYFVILVLLASLVSFIDTSCEIREDEIIETGGNRVFNCETLYVCDEENHLRIFPACMKLRCENATIHRELDRSKPWPQCCPRHTC